MKKATSSLLLALATTFSCISTGVSAQQNDATGYVGDIFYRANATEQRVYFRLNVAAANLAPCMADQDITWDLPLNSQVTDYMHKVVLKSREEQKEIRIMGSDDICNQEGVQTGDTVFELVPNWNPAP